MALFQKHIHKLHQNKRRKMNAHTWRRSIFVKGLVTRLRRRPVHGKAAAPTLCPSRRTEGPRDHAGSRRALGEHHQHLPHQDAVGTTPPTPRRTSAVQTESVRSPEPSGSVVSWSQQQEGKPGTKCPLPKPASAGVPQHSWLTTEPCCPGAVVSSLLLCIQATGKPVDRPPLSDICEGPFDRMRIRSFAGSSGSHCHRGNIPMGQSLHRLLAQLCAKGLPQQRHGGVGYPLTHLTAGLEHRVNPPWPPAQSSPTTKRAQG